MVQKTFDQSHCKICETIVPQDIIKLWGWFCTCSYTFLDSANRFNHCFCVIRKHWFPCDNNYVINGDDDYHSDDNSDNNGNLVEYNNHESDVNFIVISITMVATVMIMKTTIWR